MGHLDAASSAAACSLWIFCGKGPLGVGVVLGLGGRVARHACWPSPGSRRPRRPRQRRDEETGSHQTYFRSCRNPWPVGVRLRGVRVDVRCWVRSRSALPTPAVIGANSAPAGFNWGLVVGRWRPCCRRCGDARVFGRVELIERALLVLRDRRPKRAGLGVRPGDHARLSVSAAWRRTALRTAIEVWRGRAKCKI